MDNVGIGFWPQLLVTTVSVTAMAISLTYYVAVPIMLWKIWQKVRNLPG